MYVVKNRIEEARAASGALMAYEEIIAALTAPAVASVPDEEEDFHDPASRDGVA